MWLLIWWGWGAAPPTAQHWETNVTFDKICHLVKGNPFSNYFMTTHIKEIINSASTSTKISLSFLSLKTWTTNEMANGSQCVNWHTVAFSNETHLLETLHCTYPRSSVSPSYRLFHLVQWSQCIICLPPVNHRDGYIGLAFLPPRIISMHFLFLSPVHVCVSDMSPLALLSFSAPSIFFLLPHSAVLSHFLQVNLGSLV